MEVIIGVIGTLLGTILGSVCSYLGTYKIFEKQQKAQREEKEAVIQERGTITFGVVQALLKPEIQQNLRFK